jgi:succinate dehydrogenase flavin-adding protein (antitoxin of CptAB toxin-antitoxin module)
MCLFLDHGADPHIKELDIVLNRWSEDARKHGNDDRREKFIEQLANKRREVQKLFSSKRLSRWLLHPKNKKW